MQYIEKQVSTEHKTNRTRTVELNKILCVNWCWIILGCLLSYELKLQKSELVLSKTLFENLYSAQSRRVASLFTDLTATLTKRAERLFAGADWPKAI